jgi:hypothetical protein
MRWPSASLPRNACGIVNAEEHDPFFVGAAIGDHETIDDRHSISGRLRQTLPARDSGSGRVRIHERR